MTLWEALKDELPARIAALSSACFWLFAGVCCLISANIVQYRQRRRADKELAKANREWRDHTADLQSKLLQAQAAHLADIQSEADRAEQRAVRNWTFNAELQRKKSDAEKPD